MNGTDTNLGNAIDGAIVCKHAHHTRKDAMPYRQFTPCIAPHAVPRTTVLPTAALGPYPDRYLSAHGTPVHKFRDHPLGYAVTTPLTSRYTSALPPVDADHQMLPWSPATGSMIRCAELKPETSPNDPCRTIRPQSHPEVHLKAGRRHRRERRVLHHRDRRLEHATVQYRQNPPPRGQLAIKAKPFFVEPVCTSNGQEPK